jgi:hypothetical protein
LRFPQLTGLARHIVGPWGMSEAVGPVAVIPRDGEGPLLPGAAEVSPDTQKLIDAEVRRIVEEARGEVVDLLRSNRVRLDSGRRLRRGRGREVSFDRSCSVGARCPDRTRARRRDRELTAASVRALNRVERRDRPSRARPTIVAGDYGRNTPARVPALRPSR